MKTITLLCDVIFFVWIISKLVIYPPSKDIVIFSLGICFLLILNIIVITIQTKGNDFLSLYFKKRNLEQQIKIKELSKRLE